MMDESTFTKVIKRDGRIVPFDFKKVVSAVNKAAIAGKKPETLDCTKIAKEIITRLSTKFSETNPPSV